MLSKIYNFPRNVVGYSLIAVGFVIAWTGSILTRLGAFCSSIEVAIYTKGEDMTDEEFEQAIEKLRKAHKD